MNGKLSALAKTRPQTAIEGSKRSTFYNEEEIALIVWAAIEQGYRNAFFTTRRFHHSLPHHAELFPETEDHGYKGSIFTNDELRKILVMVRKAERDRMAFTKSSLRAAIKIAFEPSGGTASSRIDALIDAGYIYYQPDPKNPSKQAAHVRLTKKAIKAYRAWCGFVAKQVMLACRDARARGYLGDDSLKPVLQFKHPRIN